jgi:hypothetical protein
MQIIVVIMFVFRPFTVGRLLWSTANGVIDFVADVEQPQYTQNAAYTAASAECYLMLACIGIILLLFAMFAPVAPAAPAAAAAGVIHHCVIM